MPEVALYRQGPLLLLLHALCALAATGATIHQAVVAILALRGRPRPRLQRVYAWVAALTYAGTLISGGLLYPRYRYFVRALVLDRHAPWAANLFDFKENLATLGLPLALGALILGRDFLHHRDDPDALRLYGLVALSLSAIVTFNLLAGLLVTGVRGI